MDKNVHYSGHITLAWFLLSLMFVYIVWGLLEDHTPPIQDVSYEPRNSPLTEGEDLVLRVYREKNRDDCAITSIRRATNAETGITYSLPGRIWEGGVVGTEYTEFEIGTSSLPPGQYVGYLESRYDCPHDVFIYEGQYLFSIIEEDK